MTLTDLLKDAQVPSFYVGLWFRGCTLTGTVLTVPDRQLGESLVKLFGTALRGVMPTLTVKVATPPPAPAQKPPKYLNAAGRQAWQMAQAKQGKLSD